MRSILAVTSIAVLAVLTPAMAPAQEPPASVTEVTEVNEADKAKAKELFQAAVALYKDGKHAQALEKFKESYEYRPHWKLHLNIGLCYKELSMYTQAKAEFEAFLAAGGTEMKDSERTQVQTELDALATTIAVIEVAVTTSGAAVVIDGMMVGTVPLPGPVDVNPGSHVLEVELEGYEPYREEFLMSKGELKRFEISLVAVVKVDDGGMGTTGPGPIDEPKGKVRSKAAPAFWAMGGLTLALAGGAVAFGVITLGKWNDLGSLDDTTEELRSAGNLSQTQYDQYLVDRKVLQDDGELFGMLTTIFMAAGGAALVGTIVAGVLTHPLAPKAEKQPDGEQPPASVPAVSFLVSPAPLDGGGGMIVLSGSF